MDDSCAYNALRMLWKVAGNRDTQADVRQHIRWLGYWRKWVPVTLVIGADARGMGAEASNVSVSMTGLVSIVMLFQGL